MQSIGVRRAAAALAAVLLAAMTAVMASAAPAGASAGYAEIRGGHFSPDTPGVDVYLTAFDGKKTSLWLSNVGYGDVSGYERIQPGLYAVSMRPHGAAASTPAALSWTLDARPGAAYTACAVGMNAQLHGIVLHDDLSPASAGKARLRVIQAASRAAKADISAVNGPTIATDVPFATSTKYSTVAAGDYTVTARAVDDSKVSTRASVQLAADTVHTVVVLDGKDGGIAMRVLTDAAGAGTVPIGAVPAGGGGTAVGTASGGVLAGVLASFVVLVGAGGAMRRRRPAR
ncbi:MAG: DUF4397 domain-containing protein [Jatrophihabitans sp.]|uniref:DUF4397 domain-containing protein n=1 Tax=Jatrophihabitans sp. TaxID=1932789 RepID=UPI003F7E3A34